MTEIKITSLQGSHHLQSFCGFAMIGYRCCLNQLANESLQGDDVHLQVTTVNESCQSVDEGVSPKYGLLEQWVIC